MLSALLFLLFLFLSCLALRMLWLVFRLAITPMPKIAYVPRPRAPPFPDDVAKLTQGLSLKHQIALACLGAATVLPLFLLF